MATKYFTGGLLIMLMACLTHSANATLAPPPTPLPKAINQAEIIVVAHLVTYAPLPASAYPRPPSMADRMSTLKPPGKYTFRVLLSLKGQSKNMFQLNLPRILSDGYDSTSLQVEGGVNVVLLLKRDAKGQLIEANPDIPLIPLAQNIQSNIPAKSDSSVQSQIVGLMLASLDEPIMRHANLYLLRTVADARIPKVMTAYLNDPNTRIRDLALYCLAANQELGAIPRIARLERKLRPEENTIGSSALSLEALQYFKSKDAVPFLNPLLCEVSHYTRVNVMIALPPLADRSTIPYFMVALHDPDEFISFSAYGMLHLLIPLPGAITDDSLFQVQGESAMQPLYAWWKDELRGKHLEPSNTKDQPQMSPEEISALPIDKLNPLLFEPITVTRQKAMDALVERADKSSIPYLILALIDPDTPVSYDAYITLHRLIPTLGTPKSSAEFAANTEAATAPIYIWWEDELNGKHLPQR